MGVCVYTIHVTYHEIQSQTACCSSSGSRPWNSSLLSQDSFQNLYVDREKQETVLDGLQQLAAGLILRCLDDAQKTIEALAPGQTLLLQLQEQTLSNMTQR